VEELTVLTAWAEGVAEALAFAPEQVDLLLDDARPRAARRAGFGLAGLSPLLGESLDTMAELVRAFTDPGGTTGFDLTLDRAKQNRAGESALEFLVRRVLLAMLEERRTRQPV
jgi:hypothetical protein